MCDNTYSIISCLYYTNGYGRGCGYVCMVAVRPDLYLYIILLTGQIGEELDVRSRDSREDIGTRDAFDVDATV